MCAWHRSALASQDFGTDLRSCWTGLQDLEDRPICDPRSIADLAQDVAGIHAEKDETGKSGSAIVTNMRRFIIKNFKAKRGGNAYCGDEGAGRDQKARRLRKGCRWCLALHTSLETDSSCDGAQAATELGTLAEGSTIHVLSASEYNPRIAPICAVLDLPDINRRVHWQRSCSRMTAFRFCGFHLLCNIEEMSSRSVMRKVELPPAFGKRTSAKVHMSSHMWHLDTENDEVDFLDLKGPKFCGIRDGKSYFGDSVVWHRKDAGFTSLFPSGLPLRACGSREAAATLEMDSELLRDLDMTDYSLFLVPYEIPSNTTCLCQHQSPHWPLLLDADSN
ncbi:unnamed protein product [Symbiodinium pilosum]|uniref:Uncharacterized protein n=1 Tax=Symbiodinium pilosum TaxID=2952 RepID=A0A812R7B5_SYMPI|nr:unnamed protein product [Symbiodinium pilosum]